MSHAVSPVYQLAGAPPARRPARPRPVAEHSLKPRMAVIARNMADVVRCTGGWLFDQGMAGWEVSVLTTDHADPRPLRILGASGHDLDIALASPAAVGHCLRAVAVAADLYDADARVRTMILNARQARSAEVRLWGVARPAEPGRGAGQVRHRLSFAARAFKAVAVAVAAARASGDAAADVEVFYRQP